jgi:hypothetical protein
MLRFDRRPREDALRSARTNLMAPSRGQKDADNKSGGPRLLTVRTSLTITNLCELIESCEAQQCQMHKPSWSLRGDT